MVLTARRDNGNLFTPEDSFKVNITGVDFTKISEITHTIEIVSGPIVTHGGGAPAGEYLHYKSVDRDADINGNINYDNVDMQVAQLTQGTSVVRVLAKSLTKAALAQHKLDLDAYDSEYFAITDSSLLPTYEPPLIEDYKVIQKTGAITLNWSDDVSV